MPEGDRVSHRLIRALRGVPEFAPLDDDTLLRILGASHNLFWPAGSVIFEQGEPAEALYIVLEGVVRVSEEIDGGEVEAARIGPGDYFGEASLLRDSIHSKSARAVEDTELMILPKDSFEVLLDSTPELAAHMHRKLERRVAADPPKPAGG